MILHQGKIERFERFLGGRDFEDGVAAPDEEANDLVDAGGWGKRDQLTVALVDHQLLLSHDRDR